MTHRERYLNTLAGKPVDRVPDYEFGAWDQTYPRWHSEGMPEKYRDCDWGITSYFHTDDETNGPTPGVNIGLLPGFEQRILEEKGDTVILMDGDGATCEMVKSERGASIPKYLRYAIETRKDWEKIRDERLRIDDPGRVPANLDELCKVSHAAEYPVTLWCGSIYGWIRNWMGVENLSLAVYEDPEWVEEMMEHLTQVMLHGYRHLAGKAKIDSGNWWEDMCYNAGSLLSPKHFALWMVPRYKRVTGFLRRECGCEHHVLDCDGNIHGLAGMWLESGIDVMFPIESAWTDANRLEREFGPKMVFRGAFDKRALIKGPEAIDREFERLMPLFRTGRLIPHTDHRVPPDVSFENYRYYRRRKCAMLGKENREG